MMLSLLLKGDKKCSLPALPWRRCGSPGRTRNANWESTAALRDFADFACGNGSLPLASVFHDEAVAAADVPPGVFAEVPVHEGAVDFVADVERGRCPS